MYPKYTIHLPHVDGYAYVHVYVMKTSVNCLLVFSSHQGDRGDKGDTGLSGWDGSAGPKVWRRLRLDLRTIYQ